MKRFLILLSLLFCNVVFADTINLHWLNEDGTTYQDSTCVIDSDLILPSTPPTKYGYTFTGWKLTNYTPIEYLESTGTQWIDTGVVSNPDVEVILTQQLLTDTFTKSTYIFGTFDEYNNEYFLYVRANMGRVLQWSWSNNWTDTSFVMDKNKHTYRLYSESNMSHLELDGTDISTLSVSNQRNDKTLILFTARDNTIKPSIPIRLFICKIKKHSTGELVRDFIPVLDNNGTPCLLDRVEGKIYYNAGTGQFIGGPSL